MPLTSVPFTYVPGPGGGAESCGCVDWNTRTLYAFAQDFYSFNIPSQVQLNHGGAFTGITLSQGLRTIGAGQGDTRIYTGTGTSANLIIGYNSTTGATERIYNDTIPQYPACGNIATCTASGENIVVAAGLNSGQGGGSSAPVFAVNMDTLTGLGPAVQVSEIQTSIAPGNVFLGRGGDGQCAATSIGQVGGVGPPVVGIYIISLTPFSFSVHRCGGHVAADFGFTGGLNFVGFPTIDQTDGNVIACVQAGFGGGQIAMCKFDASDGHIIWQTAVGVLLHFPECRVINQRIRLQATGTVAAIIDTSTGAVTTDSVSPAVGSTNFVYSDDKFGLINALNSNNNGGANPQWSTYLLPPAPRVLGGGIIRRRS